MAERGAQAIPPQQSIGDPGERTRGDHQGYWERNSFAAYVLRAVSITIAIWVPSIGLSVAAYSGLVPGYFRPLATLVAVPVVLADVLVLYYYGIKIMRLTPPAYDPQFITSMSVGAISSMTTFMGTAAALAATVLVGTPQPVGTPSFGALASFVMPALWMFIMLTARFREACYFYQVWDLRRRRGL